MSAFNFYAPLHFFEKADAPKGMRKRIAGVISTEVKDKQKETILQRGLNLQPFLSDGWFNDNHSKDTAGVVGWPTEARKFQKGDRLPDGEVAPYHCTWAEGYLLDTARGQQLWDLGLALHKAGGERRLGFSIEGEVKRRAGADNSIVAEALVRNVAITNCPVGEGTRMETLIKSLEDAEQSTEPLDKAEAAGPFIGPRGGKWADPGHTIPWHQSAERPPSTPHQAQPASPSPTMNTPEKKEPVKVARPAPQRKWVESVTDAGLPKDTQRVHKPGGTVNAKGEYVGGTYTPERAAFHEKIYSMFLDHVPRVPAGQKPVAIVMMGGSGSGKGTVLKHIMGDHHDFVNVNADDCKEEIPEYKKAINITNVEKNAPPDTPRSSARDAAASVHEESSDMSKEILKRAQSGRKNLVLDGTGKNADSYGQKIEDLKRAGYHVQLLMPHLEMAEAQKRVKERADRSGRYVPDDFVVQAHHIIPGNFEKIAQHADEATLFDNSTPPPRPVWRLGGKNDVLDQKYVDEFKKIGVQRHAAAKQQGWMKSMVQAAAPMPKDGSDLPPSVSMDELLERFKVNRGEAPDTSTGLDDWEDETDPEADGNAAPAQTVDAAKKGMSMGTSSAPPSTMGPVTGAGAGAVITPQHLEEKQKDAPDAGAIGEGDDDDEQPFSKSEAVAAIQSRFGCDTKTAERAYDVCLAWSRTMSKNAGKPGELSPLEKAMAVLSAAALVGGDRQAELYAKSRAGTITNAERDELVKAIAGGGSLPAQMEESMEVSEPMQKSMDASGFLTGFFEGTKESLTTLANAIEKGGANDKEFRKALASGVMTLSSEVSRQAELLKSMESALQGMAETLGHIGGLPAQMSKSRQLAARSAADAQGDGAGTEGAKPRELGGGGQPEGLTKAELKATINDMVQKGIKQAGGEDMLLVTAKYETDSTIAKGALADILAFRKSQQQAQRKAG